MDRAGYKGAAAPCPQAPARFRCPRRWPSGRDNRCGGRVDTDTGALLGASVIPSATFLLQCGPQGSRTFISMRRAKPAHFYSDAGHETPAAPAREPLSAVEPSVPSVRNGDLEPETVSLPDARPHTVPSTRAPFRPPKPSAPCGRLLHWSSESKGARPAHSPFLLQCGPQGLSAVLFHGKTGKWENKKFGVAT